MKSKPVFYFFLPVLFISLLSLGSKKPGKGDVLVLIETTKGNMKIRLYEETPAHRDNFVKLVKEDFYDSLLFHRVIQRFMIQTGDPDSRNADSSQRLGAGGPGYTLPAEINTGFFHKKGALAAARRGDQVNLDKRSSGSQFYIIQGEVFTKEKINQMEKNMAIQQKNALAMAYMRDSADSDFMKKVKDAQAKGDRQALLALDNEFKKIIDALYQQQEPFRFSDEQKTIYTTTGGSPHLDGTYTIFGELIEGFDVLDSIAAVKTDKLNRPLKDVMIIDMKIVKK
jgi:cyclophilin family peptidyl-prolyl cis-trans isomerase